MSLGALHLMRPEWLWALLPVAVLAVLLWRARRQAGGWSRVIDPELLPFLIDGEQAPRRALLPWVLAAWCVAVVALAGPSLQQLPQPVHQRQEALVIVLDLSLSMKAGDLAPSRLDRARQKILDLLAARREGRTALIAYAGDPHVVAPLTDDTPTIANLLPALNPDMMPVPGSDTLAALKLGLELLHSGGAPEGRLLLVTDGVSTRQREASAELLRDAGVRLTVLGVGTAEGAPIPMADGGFLKDPSGTIVIPGLRAGPLRALASASGGNYLSLTLDNSDLEALANPPELPGRDTLRAGGARRADQWLDQGYLLILLLLPAGALLFRRGWLWSLLPLLLLAEPEPALAGPWDDLWLTPDQQGRQALEQGEPERARQLFEDPAWAGSAAYRAGDYADAAEQFASGDATDDWYNRGNALARAGQLEEAMAAYREVLEREPDAEDARTNLELLEQLRQQQEQQEQQQNQQQDQQQDPSQDQQEPGEQSGQDNPGQSGADDQSPQDSKPQDGEQDPGEEAQDEGKAGEENNEPKPPQEPAPPEEGSPAAPEQADEDSGDPASPARADDAGLEQEQEQALQQWLRRVPDDPSGLLREKFRYESRQRQQQGIEGDNDTYW